MNLQVNESLEIAEVLNWRYSTKAFDPSKKISNEDFEQLKACLRMSPSSTNIQPWHFVIADSEEGKKRTSKGCEGMFQFNAPKVTESSHVIVFASRIDADEEYLNKILDKEQADERFAAPEHREGMKNGRKMFADIHRHDLNDLSYWMEKQVYLSMGTLLLGAALMEIDAVPMEGVDAHALDKEFGLKEMGYASFAVVGLGYRAATDFNAALPKSRLTDNDIFTVVD